MVPQKTADFTEEERTLAALAKALGHPARVRILRILAQRCDCICGDIVAEVPLAQATVSQHLKALKQAGLVQGTIDGPKVCYCLNPQTLQTMRTHFTTLFENLRGKTCC